MITEQQSSRTLRHSLPRRTGPFAPASDVLDDARHALSRGVPGAKVAPALLPVALRQQRIGALRRLLAEYNAAAALDAALDAYLVRDRRCAA